MSPEPPTFDTLLAFDSYKIYVEVRALDQVIRADGVNDVLEPLIKLTVLPGDLKTIVTLLNNHADTLSGSRVMFATWPAKAKIPAFLCAIEFSSPEGARAFAPQLREFLPMVIHSSQPTSMSSSRPGESGEAPPYFTRQYGSLLLISDSSASLKSLRPNGTRLLVEDQNFRVAHDRFSSDPIFLYFNAALEDRRFSRPAPSPETAAPSNEVQTEAPAAETSVTKEAVANESPESPSAVPADPQEAGIGPGPQEQATVASAEAGPTQTPDPVPMVMSALSRALFGGSPSWPEAVGAAVALETDSYHLRLLLLNKQEQKVGPLPFMPRLISGIPLTPASPAIFPADTEVLVTASLDYSQIYDGILRTFANEDDEFRRLRRYPTKTIEADSPFAAYEKRLGFKIKDDLLPLLGHETAMSIPLRALGISPPQPTPLPPPSDESSDQKAVASGSPNPIFAVAIKDKEGVRALLPKIIESVGFKGASLLAQTEKRGDTELVSYGDALAYAFIEDFLVFSPDKQALRHLVDAHLSYETLSANSHFRNSTHWQPRQVLGQIYISPALMESYSFSARSRADSMNGKMQDFLSRLSPTSEPVTYALTNEGVGTLHELHVPKNLLMLMAAGMFGEPNTSPMAANESTAQGFLLMIASAEESYKTTKGEGGFGSIDELVAAGLIPKSLQDHGYRIELTIYGDGFEAHAVPDEYGKTGKMSYFIDQSRVLRGGDHGGSAATIADRPLQ